MYQRVKEHLVRSTNNVEGWPNAFQTSIACSHPTICKLLKVLQREQLLLEALLECSPFDVHVDGKMVAGKIGRGKLVARK